MQLGYCCINLTLRARRPPVYTGRSLTRRLFTLQKASALAVANTEDLGVILEWNLRRRIFVFRITSDLFPRMTDPRTAYRICDLPEARAIARNLREAGRFARRNAMLLSFHPGPFALFGSPRASSNIAGMAEIEAHAAIAEYICEGGKLDIPINTHVGGSYEGDFDNTARRWCANYRKLSAPARERLALENDDRPGGWSIRRLHRHIHETTGVPLTMDLHHFLFCRDSYSMEEDYLLARSTWGGRSNEVHYSESAAHLPGRAHSDYLARPLPPYVVKDKRAHVLLEAKAKELALLAYRRKFRLYDS